MAAMISFPCASGYIGSRLLRSHEEGGSAGQCFARQSERMIAGECLDESLAAATDGISNFGPATARAGVRRIVSLTIVLAVAAMLQSAHARAQSVVRTVPFVDLNRYAGDWFEIARFENRFQRQCLGDVRASYVRRADGRIDVVNRCRTGDGQTKARGIARVVDDETHAKLKVRFAPAWLSWLPPAWGDYWIIGLAPDYSWAVVGDPDREYLWILARTPQLAAKSIAAARTAAQDNGFDVERLAQTPQATGRP